MNNKVFIIEDHDEALKIWRDNKIKAIDLVHIDAHMDFGVHLARPIEQVVNKARSLKELKRGLEYSLAFRRYENDFAKQTNIGNYIYPAMEEGIIKDFYWVVPGRLKEFKKSLKLIRGMLKSFSRQDPYRSRYALHATRYTLKDGIISTNLLGRKFVICILEKLPILNQRVLLDIDTDFLVIDSLLNANNTAKIGKRKRWIRPDRLVQELREKDLHPAFTTIAYSVNGGYTPMRYKVLGDELAYRLSPRRFKQHFAERLMASTFFDLFESTGNKEYYQKAIKLNPAYCAADNNYGALYLSIRKFSKAKKEFFKVAKVDPGNPAALLGLGNIALERRDFKKAKKYFSVSLKGENSKLFKRVKIQGLLGLAQTEFRLKNFKKAKELFFHYQKNEPLQPQSRYFLGCIYEKEKNFEEAVAQYQDAMRLGLNNIEVISRLLKIACYLKTRDDIIKYIIAKYREFKRGFLRTKRLNLKKSKRIKGLQKIEEKMLALERKLPINHLTN
jgi:Tfp pilus assembly protein PilF